MAKLRLERYNEHSAQKTTRQQDGGRQPKNFSGGKFLEHLDAYNLILKLGQMGAYDSSRRIRAPDGTFVPNTDIAHLIDEAMRPNRVVNGGDAFIDLLIAGKVDPDTIVNDTLRSKLLHKMEQLQQEHNTASDGEENDREGDRTVIYHSTDTEDGTPRSSTPLPQEVIIDGRRPIVRLERIDVDKYT